MRSSTSMAIPPTRKRAYRRSWLSACWPDVETGFPTLLSEMTLTTAFRTAAASAIAAEVLARPDSRVMGMIGCGAQSAFQAIAFHELLGIDELRIFDIDGSAMEKLARNLPHIPELKVTPVGSSADAARSVDIVTTCTADKALATILTPGMVEPGMHINAVGGDCPGKTEVHVDVLRNARIFVEYEPQTRIEGDIQQLPGDHPVHELWKVIAGKEAGRESEEQVTVFDSVGFALEDYSALRYVHELAVEYGEGEYIELVPELGDPRDLFGDDAESLHRVRQTMIQTTRPIHIINVPLDLGASRRGTDAGPSAFRVAGLTSAIRSLGYSIVKETGRLDPIHGNVAVGQFQCSVQGRDSGGVHATRRAHPRRARSRGVATCDRRRPLDRDGYRVRSFRAPENYGPKARRHLV